VEWGNKNNERGRRNAQHDCPPVSKGQNTTPLWQPQA
jgi:hypothetical protein